MQERHRLALVGCGGMGRRHLREYYTLEKLEPGRIEVAAVVNPELDRAEFVSREAEEISGCYPGWPTVIDAIQCCIN